MLLVDTQRQQPPHSDTRPVEEELWNRYRQVPNDPSVLSELMEFYLPLVTHTVHRMSARVYHIVDPKDLLAVAILGLYRAFPAYSEDYGVPFRAYARRRIKGAILDELRRRDPLTREQRARLRRIQTTMDRFAQAHGRTPSDEELADLLELSPRQITDTLNKACHTISLHDEMADGLTYEEMIPDTDTPSPLESADRKSAEEALKEAIPRLDVRDQQLLFFRHSQSLSMAEIAAVFDVTPARVSQMYNTTIVRLRSLMKVDSVVPSHA